MADRIQFGQRMVGIRPQDFDRSVTQLWARSWIHVVPLGYPATDDVNLVVGPSSVAMATAGDLKKITRAWRARST